MSQVYNLLQRCCNPLHWKILGTCILKKTASHLFRCFVQDEVYARFFPVTFDLILGYYVWWLKTENPSFLSKRPPRAPLSLFMLSSFIYIHQIIFSSFNLEQNPKVQSLSVSRSLCSWDGFLMMNSTFLALHKNLSRFLTTSKSGSSQNI